ncbi:MAG: glycosyltransferase family 39 protein [Deltaproteobacteria bacterium]|nr:glycosyltransferase family 39 protein [Deltaproteobacteria bacterium]
MTRSTWLWLLLSAFAALWFATLGSRFLIGPDEGRYAEISREMALSGDWVTPRLNDLKYFEKPPLQYWTTAAAFKLFGEDEWTARLWTGLTGFLGVLLAGYTGRRLFGRDAGILATACLGSSLLWVFLGHINALDMGLAFFLEAALCGLLLAQRDDVGHRESQGWMWFTWAALAFAVLSKGIVALVLCGGTLVAYTLASRDWGLWKRLEIPRGLLIFFALASPWFIAATLANPEFPRFFFIHEHFERFLTTTHRRSQPAWYFGPILALGLLPWTTLALQALAGCWRDVRPRGGFRPRLLLGLWSLVTFGFFSLSGSKLPSYILPMFPALALLLGHRFGGQRSPRLGWHLALAALIGAALIPLGLMAESFARDDAQLRALYSNYGNWFIAAGGFAVLGAGLGWYLARRKGNLAALLALAAGGFLANMALLQGHNSLAPMNSAHAIAAQMRPLLQNDTKIYSVETYEQTLPFYLDRTVTLVAYTDEFSFGQQLEPAKWIPSVAEWKPLWVNGPAALALMKQHQYNLLLSQGWPLEILARPPNGLVIVRNRSTP